LKKFKFVVARIANPRQPVARIAPPKAATQLNPRQLVVGVYSQYSFSISSKND